MVPASFRGYWATRQERGAGWAQVHRFLDRWPWWKILLWNGLKTAKAAVWLTTLAPALWTCLQAARHSDRGLKDLGPFFYAYAVEQLAGLAGAWQATFALMEMERLRSELR